METNCLLVTRIFLIRRVYVNVRENRRGNQEWIIRELAILGTQDTGDTRHRRHKTQETQDTGSRQTKQKTQHRKLKR